MYARHTRSKNEPNRSPLREPVIIIAMYISTVPIRYRLLRRTRMQIMGMTMRKTLVTKLRCLKNSTPPFSINLSRF